MAPSGLSACEEGAYFSNKRENKKTTVCCGPIGFRNWEELRYRSNHKVRLCDSYRGREGNGISQERDAKRQASK